jgi:hypothetical protein
MKTPRRATKRLAAARSRVGGLRVAPLGAGALLLLCSPSLVAASALSGDTPPAGDAKSHNVSVSQEVVDMPSDSFSANQERLLPVARAIQAVVDPTESGRPAPINGAVDNFSEVAIDPSANTVSLYWKGSVPSAITDIIAKYPTTAVTILPAKYSLAELTAAEDLLDKTLHQTHLLGPGISLASASIDPAVGNVDVRVASDGSADTASITKFIDDLLPVPATVHVRIGEVPDTRLSSRLDDNAPYYGGNGVDLGPTRGEFCTTGFNITISASGNDYSTTAFHCVWDYRGVNNGVGSVSKPSTEPTAPSASEIYGTYKYQSSWLRPEYDTALVKMNDLVTGKVYVGAYNSSSSVTVSGAVTSVIGQSVCLDGARSGDHCSPVVTAKNGTYYNADGTRLGGNVEATSQVTAAMHGDSGGPVLDGSGTSRPGLGLLYQGQDGSETTCPSAYYDMSDGGACYKKVVFTSLTGMLNSFNAIIK